MNIQRIITTVDTHTAGGPTRNVIAGLPPLEGGSVAEKMEYFRSRHDNLRKLLMCEPRGHRDMYGAFLTPPSSRDASLGVFFTTSRGYLRACVHSSIGLAAAGLGTGFIAKDSVAPGRPIRLETPSGLVALLPEYDGERLECIAVRTRPAFVHSTGERLRTASLGELGVSIAFSGVFFLLLDVAQRGARLPVLKPEEAAALACAGVELLAEANSRFTVRHPEQSDPAAIELVLLYEDMGDRRARDIVIGRSGGVDRSPCGAGAGAKMVLEHALGRLQVGEDYVLESFLGTRFSGRILQPCRVGSFEGGLPEIRGAAHITGMHQFVLDAEDPLPEGLLF